MSTVFKAADLIGRELSDCPSYRQLEIARILDDAGLLAPDLPKPVLEYKDGGACWLDSEITSVESHYDSDSDESIITAGIAYDLTPTEAKQLAYALLAAAQWAEKEPS
ncbi:hypothetical protein ACXM2N_03390 [Corynebacterium sp. ZY180755]